MNPDFAVEIIRMMIMKAVQLAAPVLMIAMFIGLGVSLAQAVTSVSEQTLSFVPKTMGIAAFLVAAAPWIVRTLIEFTRWIIQLAPQMVG